jgi:hypothetical protein
MSKSFLVLFFKKELLLLLLFGKKSRDLWVVCPWRGVARGGLLPA